MKELIKKYWWVILIIGWGITFLIYSQKIKNKTQDLQFANVELSSLRDTVNTFKTKNGELVGQINSVVIDRDIAKKSLEQIGIDVKKLREENVKLKTLNLALNAQLSSSGTIYTTKRDTIYMENNVPVTYSFINDWSDGRLSLFNGYIKNNDIFTDYTYNLKFKLLVNTEKNKSIVTFVPEDDSNKTILSSANSITIMDKKPPFYKKWWLWAAIGFTGGILMTK